jgi:hypothetical protein
MQLTSAEKTRVYIIWGSLVLAGPIYLLVTLFLAYSHSPDNLIEFQGYAPLGIEPMVSYGVIWLIVLTTYPLTKLLLGQIDVKLSKQQKDTSNPVNLILRKTMIACSLCDFPIVCALAFTLLNGGILNFAGVVFVGTAYKVLFKPALS